MQKPLATKVEETVRYLRALWPRLEGRYRFVAFSTGKDSLAMTAMLYEAVEPERPICLYSHHALEVPCNLEYLEELKNHGFVVSVVNPFLGYFDLMGRTYCICCYTSDARRQEYSSRHFPEVCARYYGQIEHMLFDSGLLDKAHLLPEHRTKEEKLGRHGFVHWNRIKAQDVVGWRHRFWRRVVVEGE